VRVGAVAVSQVEGRWWQGGLGRWASGVVAGVNFVMIMGGEVG
jgi:hypothetical protein